MKESQLPVRYCAYSPCFRAEAGAAGVGTLAHHVAPASPSAVSGGRGYAVDSQRTLYPVPEVRLLPAREFPLDDKSTKAVRELLRIEDRHQRAFCLGPTHEEIITDLMRTEIRSYRDLPANFYQLQTKFRDEIRPRFGVMRAREFLMKDAYSFHLDQASLGATYDRMYIAYSNIFRRLGLEFRPVLADTGSIGGSHSHEFHVLADSGEDAIAFSDGSDYAANVEMAEALAPTTPRPAAGAALQRVATPTQTLCADVAALLDIPVTRTVKAIAVVAGQDAGDQAVAQFHLLLLRGDHELNEIKAAKVIGAFRLASEAEIVAALGCKPGFIGPVGASTEVRVTADRTVASMGDFVCGANQEGFHLSGVNFGRDLPEPEIADLRNVVAGDPSPDGRGALHIRRGIEVGHIFQLGTKYSAAMNARVLDENGREQVMLMGCYGIGVTRVVAAAIEQNHDQRGIVWPPAIAPFSVAIVPVNAHQSERVATTCEQLYRELTEAGIEVLFMDRPKIRLGVMLADVELMGIPWTLVVGERGLDNGLIECSERRTGTKRELPLGEVTARLREEIAEAETASNHGDIRAIS